MKKPAAGLSLSSADSAGAQFSLVLPEPAEDDVGPSPATVYGRLNNTEVLSHLDKKLSTPITVST